MCVEEVTSLGLCIKLYGIYNTVWLQKKKKGKVWANMREENNSSIVNYFWFLKPSSVYSEGHFLMLQLILKNNSKIGLIPRFSPSCWSFWGNRLISKGGHREGVIEFQLLLKRGFHWFQWRCRCLKEDLTSRNDQWHFPWWHIY